MDEAELTLPGVPGTRLEALWGNLSPRQKAALRPHLLGFTSAEWVADLLRQHGHDISASTIRTYRRATRQEGV